MCFIKHAFIITFGVSYIVKMAGSCSTWFIWKQLAGKKLCMLPHCQAKHPFKASNHCRIESHWDYMEAGQQH